MTIPPLACSFALLVSLSAAPLLAGDPPTASEAAVRQDHALAPLYRIAHECLARLENDVRDYTCTLVMRERRDGKLKPYQFIETKVRHEDKEAGVPFSVYMNFKKPSSVAGREVLYLEGRNSGNMLVRRGGNRLAYITTYLDPMSSLALEENRYPVSEIGFKKLLHQLIGVMDEDMQHEECTVKFYKNAKVGDSVCTRIIVEHPYKRDYFRYHRAMVFIEESSMLPLAYGSYTWPDEPGGAPVLVEEYIHTNVKLNVGLTDIDFDRENPDYGFLQRDSSLASQE